MKTRAVRQGDYYIVNGTKRFITGAEKAHFGQVMAVADPLKDHMAAFRASWWT